MAEIILKPRWEEWENICLQKAFAQKIQHKIMAMALGRTVPSVSKKIRKLGLRILTSTPGRIKGTKQDFPQAQKTSQDFSNMIKILKTYAPVHCYQKGELALRKGSWTKSRSFQWDNQNKDPVVDKLTLPNPSFSFVSPLDFIPSNDPFPQEITRKAGTREPTYVSLCYIDEWANLEGFQRVTGILRHKGVCYWKDGAYFSQTQLLMHLNHFRFEKRLEPLAVYEERD